MEYLGPAGTRRVPIKEHYVSAGKTSLAHSEILLAVIIPKESYENCFGYYIKYAMREALDIATLGCSANVRLSADTARIDRLRLAYGVAGPVPLRAPSAEAAAAGKPLSEAAVAAAAGAALGDINPRTSWRAGREFRLHLAEELAKRAIRESIKRAGGSL
jgi:xanthine dehydrogenase FAD-binding subunit